MIDILSLTSSELAAELKKQHGKGLFHAGALCREVFKHGNLDFSAVPEFGARWAQELQISLPECAVAGQESDEVTKFVTRLHDAQLIESVIIPADGRTTLCISSQVGCGRGCAFCTTARLGLKRNLSVSEIIWQVWAARHQFGHRIDNIVFMGMGEPFDNFESVMQAVRVLNDPRTFGIGPSHITISTAGHADGIEKLAAIKDSRLRLAVSLNAAGDELRDKLMPINRTYPLARLKDALQKFPLKRDEVIFFEYVLLPGVNDRVADADGIAAFLAGIPARLNLIAYNGGEPFKMPNDMQVEAFRTLLVERGIFVRLRQSRGQQIRAACGQLGAKQENLCGRS